jgi:hypothetical protein
MSQTLKRIYYGYGRVVHTGFLAFLVDGAVFVLFMLFAPRYSGIAFWTPVLLLVPAYFVVPRLWRKFPWLVRPPKFLRGRN